MLLSIVDSSTFNQEIERLQLYCNVPDNQIYIEASEFSQYDNFRRWKQKDYYHIVQKKLGQIS